MMSRAAQRERTRARILDAALDCFSERGFLGASTREIARRAGENQGLLTYHFRSKEELWRAAVEKLFGQLRAALGAPPTAARPEARRAEARESVRAFVRFAAAHPELFRLMMWEGTCDEPRMQWIVDTHLRPIYDAPGLGDVVDPELKPHFHYVLAGAASIIFSVKPECRRLTGVDPSSSEAIERHADFVAKLLIPCETASSL